MRFHGLSAMAALFAGGLVAAGHVPRGLMLRRNLTSGLTLGTLGLLLALSGYALWYFASEAVRPPLGIAHTALGALAFAVGLCHAR